MRNDDESAKAEAMRGLEARAAAHAQRVEATFEGEPREDDKMPSQNRAVDWWSGVAVFAAIVAVAALPWAVGWYLLGWWFVVPATLFLLFRFRRSILRWFAGMA